MYQCGPGIDRGTSVAEPQLKPNLIDRFIVSAERSGLATAIIINKVDLADAGDLQPAVGVWSQMGYPVLLTSAETGAGVERVRGAGRGPRQCRCGTERRWENRLC